MSNYKWRKSILYSLIPFKRDTWTDFQLIAHAGGGIQNEQYTNSLEALKQSYKAGFRLLEFDVAITSDDKLIARHTWDEPLGQKTPGGQASSYSDFINDLYFDKFHPLSFKQILHFMEFHPNVYVILDGKVESPDDVVNLYGKINCALRWTPSHTKNRLIAQMFYKDDLSVLRKYGFKNILYVVGRESYTAKSLSTYCADNAINAVSLSTYRTNAKLVNNLNSINIKSYTYTVDDEKEAMKYVKMGVHGFFTNFMQPSDKLR